MFTWKKEIYNVTVDGLDAFAAARVTVSYE